MYKSLIKRVLDFFVAFIGLVLLSPILVVVFIILLVVNKGKPFFFQQRPGLNEKVFKIIKFKTMNDKKDENGKLLAPDKRLTKTGIFIRKYSLDEIPQLINVIKGDMSVVGPRPLLIRYLPRYNDFQKQRHTVKPGITGWAQVNGRNAIGWEQKFKLDVFYVQNISFLLDFKILLKTVHKVLKKDGIYSSNNEIVPDFYGKEAINSNR
jgi:lipopolysaccharide/colanic/teichoic acid biosynthesis glycosyltransferase